MVYLLTLFVLRFNDPVNNFSVMSRQSHSFLGINQYSGELMSLAQGHSTMLSMVMEPRTLDLKSDAQHRFPSY